MNTVDKYFKKITKDIGFLELKEDVIIGEGKYISKDIPLPIITDKLVKKIELGDFDEGIDLTSIVEGIIYIMGADKNFPYINEYKVVLKMYRTNISNYLLHEANRNIQEGLWDIGGLWLRSLLLIDENNIDGLFNYGLVLEEIGNRFINQGNEEVGHDFIKNSTNKFETILDIDEDYALAYYKLGYHYKYSERYLKSNLIWKKFLVLSKDDILLQEIRDEIDKIKDDAYFEAGLSYLNFNDYDRALEALLKLLPKHKESWNVNFLIGQAYDGQGQYEKATHYMEEALGLNKETSEIYNELGIIYFNLGDVNKAIEVFNEGIENCKEDYKLFFNRGLGYVDQGLYELGLKDIEKAEELNPNDRNIAKQREEVMEFLA